MSNCNAHEKKPSTAAVEKTPFSSPSYMIGAHSWIILIARQVTSLIILEKLTVFNIYMCVL